MEPPLSPSLSLSLPPIDEVSLGLVELIRFIDASLSLSLVSLERRLNEDYEEFLDYISSRAEENSLISLWKGRVDKNPTRNFIKTNV